MEYLSLYRKYRPKKFSEVVGQDIVIKILKNSIENNKINHAYIFSGPRGTGKTSIAKIFAKAVNCMNNLGDVCDECSVCTNSINYDLDIIEIDAASNNGVDEIREIKNNSKLLPSVLKYRVYIIDEVHMLSNSAFNALLKTLEEPPSHIIFIFATTEINKIPATVLSRCQKFDFKKLSNSQIINRLNYILDCENKKIPKNIVELIANQSDGGLRDAINYLDQVLAVNNPNVTEDEFFDMIGIINNKKIFELFDYIVDSNVKMVVELIKNYIDSGFNFTVIIERLENIIKDILIYNNTNNYFSKKYEKDLNKYSKIDIDKLYKISNDLFDLLYELKKNNSRLLVEIYLIKITLYFNKNNNSNFKNDEIINNNNVKTNDNPSDDNSKLDNLENKEIHINNALSTANKVLKNNFLEEFKKINDYIIDKEYNSICSLLIKSSPEVVSEKHIIFTFDNSFDVLLLNKNVKEANKLLYKILKKKYIIISLTKKEWENIKKEYINNIKNGVKYQYIEPKKESNSKKSNDSELENNIENIFGDNYKIERND